VDKNLAPPRVAGKPEAALEPPPRDGEGLEAAAAAALVKPPEVFSLPPLKTELFARLPFAILLTTFFIAARVLGA
jgi:hypothetical protein